MPKYLDLSAKVIVRSEEMFGNAPKEKLQSDANKENVNTEVK